MYTSLHMYHNTPLPCPSTVVEEEAGMLEGFAWALGMATVSREDVGGGQIGATDLSVDTLDTRPNNELVVVLVLVVAFGWGKVTSFFPIDIGGCCAVSGWEGRWERGGFAWKSTNPVTVVNASPDKLARLTEPDLFFNNPTPSEVAVAASAASLANVFTFFRFKISSVFFCVSAANKLSLCCRYVTLTWLHNN